MRTDLTKEVVTAAALKSHGFISELSRHLNCSRTTAEKYKNKWAETRQAFEDGKRNTAELLIQKLVELGLEGNVLAINSFLNAQGEDYGFGYQKHKVEHGGGITFVAPDSLKD